MLIKYLTSLKSTESKAWWLRPVIPALKKLRQEH
jgi:hypothetical protein